MHVSALSGGDPEVERRLANAGVPTAEQLARVADVAALSAQAGVPAERLAELQAAAHAAIEQALQAAGVADERALAEADIIGVSSRTGIAPAEVARLRDAARRKLGMPEEGARVVLREGAPTASVVLGAGASIDDVPILTAAPRADAPQEALARYPGDAVVLQGGADVALARLAGETRAALPVFKRNEDGSELRVRVLEIRDRSAAPAKQDAFWRRVFRR